MSQVQKLAPLVALLKSLLTRSNSSKAILAYVLYIVFKYRNCGIGTRVRNDLPGPRGYPLIGNLISMTTFPKSRMNHRHADFYDTYGDTWTISSPGIRIIHVDDPDCLDHVLRTNFWAYEKGPRTADAFHDLLGNGIFSSDGAQWKMQRKLASNVFNVRAFRDYTSNVFCHEGQILVDHLSKMADEGQVVDLHSLFYKFTLDSFGQICFAKSFGCLKNPDEDVDFALAFDYMNEASSDRVITPLWKLKEWMSGKAARVKRDRATLRAFGARVIQERRTKGYTGQHKDLLQLFMDTRDDEGNPLSEEMLVDAMMNFILAGRDTTAQALSWMMSALYRETTDKSVVDKLVEEIDTVLQGGPPTYESTKKQKYAEAVLYESLRLFPSVPKNMKMCVQDDVLPNGTKIYKGEWFAWSTWTMGRAEAIWGKDAKVFNPDRWMNQKEVPSPAKYPVFHVGPRLCLGKSFATIESISIMSMLFQKFTFEPLNNKDIPGYIPALTMPMQDGLKCRVMHRKDIPQAI